VILGYAAGATEANVDPDWRGRRAISLRLAESFLRSIERRGIDVEPVGAAQGWSPASYADSVRELQDMGYRRIALGGMVPLKTDAILDCLKAIDEVRAPVTELHLLGVTRVETMDLFADHGVTSFDSTSPFRQAFMDDRRNYHVDDTAYVAIRVPQVDGNASLKRSILAGVVSQREAVATERECLKRLRALDTGSASVEGALEVLARYEVITASKNSYLEQYRRTLEAAAWRTCDCSICRKHGVEITIFRGTERNKRRGFHNLTVLARKVRSLRQSA
jgi:hypothetical protein